MSTAAPGTWQDKFFQKDVQQAGAPLPSRPAINFIGNVSCADNAADGTTDVTIGSGGGQYTTPIDNGLNSDIPTNGLASLLLGGASGEFQVGGFALPGGATWAPDQRLTVMNTTGQPWTVIPEDTASTATNRIDTQSGSPYIMPARNGTATFVYNGTTKRLVLQNPGVIQPVVTHHVRDFGAVGNANFYHSADKKWYVDSGFVTEATDDSPSVLKAFQAAAITTALGIQSTVRLSGNHYLKTPTASGVGPGNNAVFFTLTSNMVVDGGGGTLRQGPGLLSQDVAILWSDSSISNVTIRNVVFDGNYLDGQTVANKRNPFIALFGEVSTNVTIEDCQFTNHVGWTTVIITAFDGSGTLGQNIRVVNCGFVNCGNGADLTDHVTLYVQGEGVTVTGNVFFNDPATNDVSRNEGAAMQLQGNGIAVCGNAITNHCNACLFGSAFTTPNCQSSDFTFCGNTILACSIGLGLFQSVGLTLDDLVISGNSFSISNDSAGQLESGIQLLNVNGSNGFGVNRMTITGNVFRYVHDSRWADAEPVAINFGGVTTACTIAGNTFTDWPTIGIYVGPAVASNPNAPTGNVVTGDLKIWDLTIRDNVLKDCGVSGGYGILVQCDNANSPPPVQRLRISGNHLSSTGSALATGIDCAIAGDDIQIVGNQFQNVTTPQTLTSSNGLTNAIQGGQLYATGSSAFAASVGYDTAASDSTLVQRTSAGAINGVAVTGTGLGTFVGLKVSDGSGHLATISYDDTTLEFGDSGKFVGFAGTPILANSQWFNAENDAGSGQVLLLGLDVNNAVRISPSGDAVVVVGAPATITNAVAGDLVVESSVRFPYGSSSAIAALGTDASGNAYLGSAASGVRVGIAASVATGGTPAVLGSGTGVAGNPVTATQNGWLKMYDSSGAAFWLPIWR